MTRKKEQKEQAKIRKEAVATTIKEIKGKVPTIRSLKRQGMSEKENDLHAKVNMRIIMSYLTLRIGFLPLKGIRKTSRSLILLRLPITSETRISYVPTTMRQDT